MRSAHRTLPAGGAYSRRSTDYAGIFFDEFATDSAWIREQGTVHLPPLDGVRGLILRGEVRPHPDARGLEVSAPALHVSVNGQPVGTLADLRPGPWELAVALPAADRITLTLRLSGTSVTNTLAWLGRVSGLRQLQRFRAQNKNRQLRLGSIGTAAGEIIYDFSRRHSPYSADYARAHVQLGLNIVGFLTADLGVGESARCMVRAADAACIPSALVPLKLNCKNRLGDQTYASRLQDTNPYGVNVVHLDPPASRDLDHHHGPAFRAGKYNIGYFAWELPEFPDAWTSAFDFFDEIWTPSDFATAAIAIKSPLPVFTMPHAIAFPRPTEAPAALRSRLGLPADPFLFLTLFDLNSYAERKNPRAVIAAFRASGLAGRGAALVIKVQNVAGNEADFAALQESVRDLPGTVLLTGTLSRADIYALEAACDCFVSLHRSEGFGLAVAEAMYLGKPVISTDWSATAEFVTGTNGCPVRAPLITLDRHHGPYAKGATWADPDPAHAADHMRRLFADRTLCAGLGAAARATIETRFSPAAIGARYRRRLEAIATF
ncbi:MAG: glycosyltransferase family 4 protein [Verrucomicrobia bacterium]|nr:glycosyltransferase family 4 protein [Verrucomicrobiota bacterium]